MSDELSDLLQPLTLDWRVSELRKWIEAYTDDNNLQISFFQLVNGLQINQEWAGGIQGAIVGFHGEKLEDGQIRLAPYLDDTARAHPSAVEELRRLRNAIEVAGGITPQKSKRGPRPRTVQEMIEALKEWDSLDRDIYAITLEEWLEGRYGATGGGLNVAVSTFHGWRRYLRTS